MRLRGMVTPISLVMTPKNAKQTPSPPGQEGEKTRTKTNTKELTVYFVDVEYLVTAFVPSDTACFASSPGRIRRTLIESVSV